METTQNEEEVFTAGYIEGASGRTDMSEAQKKSNAKDAYRLYREKRSGK